jgi:hypothetical protein
VSSSCDPQAFVIGTEAMDDATLISNEVFGFIGQPPDLAEKLMFPKGTAFLAAASIRPYVNALQ